MAGIFFSLFFFLETWNSIRKRKFSTFLARLRKIDSSSPRDEEAATVCDNGFGHFVFCFFFNLEKERKRRMGDDLLGHFQLGHCVAQLQKKNNRKLVTSMPGPVCGCICLRLPTFSPWARHIMRSTISWAISRDGLLKCARQVSKLELIIVKKKKREVLSRKKKKSSLHKGNRPLRSHLLVSFQQIPEKKKKTCQL